MSLRTDSEAPDGVASKFDVTPTDLRRSTVTSFGSDSARLAVRPAIVASVLMVDDHPANLLALEGILEPLGLRLVRASSGEEALKRLLHEDFALILMDVQMPGIDGLQTAGLIKERERSRHIPIIFLTAISKDAAYVFKGYAQGAVDYLFKPFDPDILRSKVSVFVELYVRGEQLKQQEALIRQREREELERANELRYHTLTNAMPLILWAGDAEGKITLCNRAWYDYTGLSLDETKNGGWLGITHPDDEHALTVERTRCVEEGQPFEMEYRMRRHDGDYRWFLVRAVPERDLRGAICGWIGTGTDIDDQKRDREALSQFKSTLDATSDGVFIIAPDSLHLCYVNDGAAKQLGYERERLLSMSILAVTPELDEPQLRALLQPLRDGAAESQTYRTHHRRSDGTLLPVETIAQYIPLPSGGKYVAIVRDVSEQVRTEMELRRLNVAKDEFLAAASHELRTPLAAAKAQAQLALRRLREAPDEGPKRSLGIIGGQIDRMAKLVENLLDVSRLEAGRLTLELFRFDVAATVRAVCEQMQALSDAHRIEQDLPEQLMITADRDRIEQIVNNLLSNALRYSPRGGAIEVSLAGEGENVLLTVRDHGVGIPLDKQAMIFERFGRAHGSKYGGLGLGLTISQGIVQQHGGSISVASDGEGHGSTFRVRLPIDPVTRPQTNSDAGGA